MMGIWFVNIEAFMLLIPLIVLFFKDKGFKSYKSKFSKDMYKKIFTQRVNKKIPFILLLVTYILIVFSIARPVMKDESYDMVKSDSKFLVAFDISTSMNADDIYPSRLEFVKNKFNNMLNNLDGQKLGLLAFAKQPYLISAITSDYNSLKFSVDNLNLDSIDTNGSNILELLKSVPVFLNDVEEKVILIFTDGTESDNFKEAIEYANAHNIKVFIYATATKVGTSIKTLKGILKDNNQNIVISNLNSNIESLANKTDGTYVSFSLENGDINNLLKPINKILNEQSIKSGNTQNIKELFYYPLVLALEILTLVILGIIGRRND